MSWSCKYCDQMNANWAAKCGRCARPHLVSNPKHEWSYDDIPIGKFNVVTEPDLITGEIKQITNIAGKITEEIIQTKSEQIRNALIDLGWTPPE